MSSGLGLAPPPALKAEPPGHTVNVTQISQLLIHEAQAKKRLLQQFFLALAPGACQEPGSNLKTFNFFEARSGFDLQSGFIHATAQKLGVFTPPQMNRSEPFAAAQPLFSRFLSSPSKPLFPLSSDRRPKKAPGYKRRHPLNLRGCHEAGGVVSSEGSVGSCWP